MKKRKTRTTEMKKRISKKLQKQKGKPTGIFPRGLARSVAKSMMQRSGWNHINDGFSMSWQAAVRRIAGKEKKAS